MYSPYTLYTQVHTMHYFASMDSFYAHTHVHYVNAYIIQQQVRADSTDDSYVELLDNIRGLAHSRCSKMPSGQCT